ncbi:hypothetical protein TNCV_1857551 [Trichonephila clavipes]|nr:hypothetical protein TNCV_1857551 [Trichonephila clavipes]
MAIREATLLSKESMRVWMVSGKMSLYSLLTICHSTSSEHGGSKSSKRSPITNRPARLERDQSRMMLRKEYVHLVAHIG